MILTLFSNFEWVRHHNHCGLWLQAVILSGLGLVIRHGDAGSSDNSDMVPNIRHKDWKDVVMFGQLEGDHGSRDPVRSVYQLTNSMYQLWKWMALQSKTYSGYLTINSCAYVMRVCEMVGLRCHIVEGCPSMGSGNVTSEDLGGSSNYSSAILEGRWGEGFLANSNCSRVNRS